MYTFTEIDLAAVLVIFLYGVLAIRAGLWSVLFRLVSLVGSVYIALLWYEPFGRYIAAHFPVSALVASVIGFLFLMIVLQELVSVGSRYVVRKFPNIFFENAITRTLAILPGALEGISLVVIFVAASSLLPLPTNVQQKITLSWTHRVVATHLPAIESLANALSGNRFSSAISLVTSGSEEEGTTPLPFKPSVTSVDEAGELQMLVLTNQERAANGVGPLTMDTQLVAVARTHSEDMWDQQYFSHVNPAGQSPFDRMHAVGISYETAGENLALAPSVDAANTGLMHSPGHRANILDPDFHHVGMGIIDGGIYGKMVTEDFTN
jgi:uncharacterized protein YkwD